MTERWLPVRDNARYEVSDMGRVRSLWFHNRQVERPRATPLMLRPTKVAGYQRLSIGRPSVVGSRTASVSTLVLEAFVGPRPDGYEAAHLNGRRDDDRLLNLAWVSHTENESHKVAHGTVISGTRNHNARLTEPQVQEIRRRSSAGESFAALGRAFAVSSDNVALIVKRKAWRHV